MNLTFFKAPQSRDLGDDTATAVVDRFEEHVAMKITEANKGLEATTKALDAKLESTAKGLEAQLRALTWLVGSFGVIISLTGVMGAVATFGPPIQRMLWHWDMFGPRRGPHRYKARGGRENIGAEALGRSVTADRPIIGMAPLTRIHNVHTEACRVLFGVSVRI